MGIKLYFLLSALLGNNLLKDSCAKMGSLSARKKRTYYLYYYIMLFSNFIGGSFAAKFLNDDWILIPYYHISSCWQQERTELLLFSSKASNLTSRVRWQIALDNCFPTRGYHKAKDHQRWKSPSSVQKICAQTLMRYTENLEILMCIWINSQYFLVFIANTGNILTTV